MFKSHILEAVKSVLMKNKSFVFKLCTATDGSFFESDIYRIVWIYQRFYLEYRSEDQVKIWQLGILKDGNICLLLSLLESLASCH